jgi:NADH-quinone oxidoreductase subunit H
MITSAPLWSVLAVPAVLAGFTVVAVTADAVLAGRTAGRSMRMSVAAPAAGAARLLAGQRRRTLAPDALLWRIGLWTVPAAGILAALVIPFGTVTASRMSVGVVWFNAMEVLTWAGLWMAGWGANSALSLIAGYRYVAQGLAYELPLMFALISVAAGAQSLSVADISAAQSHLWFAVWMPVAFAVYLASVYAFSLLGPFGYPTGPDVAGGVLAEVSGVDRLAIEAGRWLLLTAGAGMAVPLFLGGGAGPVLPAWAWSAIKTLVVLGVLTWGRQRLPVLRADRYTEFAWVILLPLSVLQALVPALVDLTR